MHPPSWAFSTHSKFAIGAITRIGPRRADGLCEMAVSFTARGRELFVTVELPCNSFFIGQHVMVEYESGRTPSQCGMSVQAGNPPNEPPRRHLLYLIWEIIRDVIAGIVTDSSVILCIIAVTIFLTMRRLTHGDTLGDRFGWSVVLFAVAGTLLVKKRFDIKRR